MVAGRDVGIPERELVEGERDVCTRIPDARRMKK
jgi:hypothetical protein